MVMQINEFMSSDGRTTTDGNKLDKHELEEKLTLRLKRAFAYRARGPKRYWTVCGRANRALEYVRCYEGFDYGDMEGLGSNQSVVVSRSEFKAKDNIGTN